MKLTSILWNKRFNPETMGPIKHRLNNAKETLKRTPGVNQWLCGGYRSAAIAAELLLNEKIVALPTDTIYGLAGLAQSDESIAKLYTIKKRDINKPLAICLWDVKDIEKWAHVSDLPEGLAEELLPGPTTLVLKRKPTLNPSLNPGVTNVGIRVPKFDFVRSVVKLVNQPIALTSANLSNQRSTLHPSEFTELWPLLDGIFYEKMSTTGLKNSWRKGSTVVDLSKKGEFSILRKGIGFCKTLGILKNYNLVETKKAAENQPGQKQEKEDDEEGEESEEEESKVNEKEASASA